MALPRSAPSGPPLPLPSLRSIYGQPLVRSTVAIVANESAESTARHPGSSAFPRALAQASIGEQVVSNRFVLAAFVLVGLLAACRDGHAAHSPATVARTGRFTMTITATAPGRRGTLRASGTFDDDRRRYAVDADVEGFVPGLDGPLAVVATPEAVFVDCPYLTARLRVPTRWIKLIGASGDIIRSSLLDPLQSFVRNGRAGFVP